MGKTCTFTDLEWEFLQTLDREQLLNLAMDYNARPEFLATRAEFARDNLGENILARLAAATTVPDPGPPTTITPGAPAPMGVELTSQINDVPPTYY